MQNLAKFPANIKPTGSSGFALHSGRRLASSGGSGRQATRMTPIIPDA
jgi:hypothetical protein